MTLPKFEPVEHPTTLLPAFLKGCTVEGCEIATQRSRAAIEVVVTPHPPSYKKNSRWRFYWSMEFEPVMGWDMRYYARGWAKSVAMAKQNAVDCAYLFIASVSKAPTKSARLLSAENLALKAELNRLKHNSGMLRYTIKQEVRDEAVRRTLLDHATVGRIG